MMQRWFPEEIGMLFYIAYVIYYDIIYTPFITVRNTDLF